MTAHGLTRFGLTGAALATSLVAALAMAQGWGGATAGGQAAPLTGGAATAQRPRHAPGVPSTNTDIGADMDDPNMLVTEGRGGGSSGARALLLNTLRDESATSQPKAAGAGAGGGQTHPVARPDSAR
jgi:hypothetical protein